LGYALYKGRGFDAITLKHMFENPVYMGFKTANKWTHARHKRYTQNQKNGEMLEDVPECEKGKHRRRDRSEWIIPAKRTHEAIIDPETWKAAQAALAKYTPRKYHPPRSEQGWLKPLLYCGHCGRQMVCKWVRGEMTYHCITPTYRSNRPDDPRFKTECGHNSVRHAQVEETINQRLAYMRIEIAEAIENGAVKRLEKEICQNRDAVWALAEIGYKQHLRGIWDTFDLDESDSALAKKIRPYLSPSGKTPLPEIDEFVFDLTEIERLKIPIARAMIDQLREDHRHMTVAQAKPTTTPMQVQVLQAECARIEARIATCERHLSPVQERMERLEAEYQELQDRRDEAVNAMRSTQTRGKGAALAGVFAKILLYFDKENEGFKGRGRHGRLISVWKPEKTAYVYVGQEIAAESPEQSNLETPSRQRKQIERSNLKTPSVH
jgi:hypothetical protein